MTFNILMTAAGPDSKSFGAGMYDGLKLDYPDVGNSILKAACNSYFSEGAHCILVMLANETPKAINNLGSWSKNEINLITLKAQTRGALASAMMAIEHLDLNLPIFIVPADSYIDIDINTIYRFFLESDVEGGTVVFTSESPRWSYARISNENRVIEMAEKLQVSKFASTGIFYFKSGEIFRNAASWVFTANMTTKGDFFVSAAINYLVLNAAKVSAYKLAEPSLYHPLSTINDVNGDKIWN